jgi:hypothetical protein
MPVEMFLSCKTFSELAESMVAAMKLHTRTTAEAGNW